MHAEAQDAIWLPWGGVHAITGSATLDARFPGQWFQLESGLHYNWHRQYDPSIGRYTQPDPLGFVDGPSVYGYAGGDPESWTDADGRRISWKDLKEFWKNLRFDGPNEKFLRSGQGRICQIRYKQWFIRLDYQSVPPNVPTNSPELSIDVGSDKPGDFKTHIRIWKSGQ